MRKILFLFVVFIISIMLTGCNLSGKSIWEFLNRLQHSADLYFVSQEASKDNKSPLKIDNSFDFSEELVEGQAAGGLAP